ncbi:MAG: hypothetical protein ACHQ7M_13400 [Chloroflexota bacterium]
MTTTQLAAQALQVIGAVLILVAFSLVQFHRMETGQYSYLLLNVVGSAILASLAYLERQWGFLLLEGVWALVSLWSLAVRAKGCAVAGGH